MLTDTTQYSSGAIWAKSKIAVADGWNAGPRHAGGFEVRWKNEALGRVEWLVTGSHNEAVRSGLR